jgi:formate dehydrogenase iron-sulfur subunit
VEIVDRIMAARAPLPSVMPANAGIPLLEGGAEEKRDPSLRWDDGTLAKALYSRSPARIDTSLDAQTSLLRDLCDTMKYGSLCALGGFTPYPVLSALDYFPEDFGASAPIKEAAE